MSLFVAGAIGYRYLIDWENRPFCHKQHSTGFKIWMMDRADTNSFPNVGGKSRASLMCITNEMGTYPKLWADGYRYIAGLRGDDPGELVLMYIERPTRWIWHGQPRTVFHRKNRLIVPVDFGWNFHDRTNEGPGECSEWISEQVFQRRLSGTLTFLATNNRPHWQVVLKEHADQLSTPLQLDPLPQPAKSEK